MSQYGFTGFPLRDSIPRGFSFVHFMRMQHPRSPAPPPVPPAPAAPTTPGEFSDTATESTLSRKQTPLPGGVTRTDTVKQFSDGSRRTEVHHAHPDGTFEIATERRSLPDEDGFQKVRVWQRTTAPDGSKSGTFRLFRVPDGAQMNWDAAESQQFMLKSVAEGLNPDGTVIPDLMARVADATDGAVERRPSEDVPAPKAQKPVIPLAP